MGGKGVIKQVITVTEVLLWQTNRYCLLCEADRCYLSQLTGVACYMKQTDRCCLSQTDRCSLYHPRLYIDRHSKVLWESGHSHHDEILSHVEEVAPWVFMYWDNSGRLWHAPGRLGSSKKQPWRRLQGTPGGWNPAKQLPGSCLRTSQASV